MEGKDHIKDLFQEKLSQLEVPVRPEIWSAVSSQIGAAAPAAAGGLSIISKIIIGISVAASVSVGVYLVTKGKEEVKDQARTAQQTMKLDNTNDTSTSKTVENNEEPVVFNKIIELPSDIPFKSDEELDLKENLETRVLREDPIDKTTDSKELPEPERVPVIDPKKEPLNNKQTEENTDSTIDEATDNVVIQESKIELKLVNTFTPNNDGVNDELMIESKGLSDFNLVVLDRSNNVVYQTNDPDFRWNGMSVTNEMVPAGMYVYYLTAKDSNGKIISRYSPLEIIK
jgi:gliding motility-associated-like protein